MSTMQEAHKTRERLEYYYSIVKNIILARQNPCTGLIPASVAVTSHGDYRDAWVRDNVYSIMAVYGLAMAYRRMDDDSGRAYELEHAVVKCMRGLLFAMMRQAAKVEQFKSTQHLLHCLHAKYNTNTGDTVVGDDQWGHLQLDATSIFLLSLAQMTASGMQIVYTQDEVDFVQNLVYYIERAYRTPDYGVWERGNKSNHGQPELNSSSIGMATAALQAINGINLFGARGGHSSIIYCMPDEISRNSAILHSALPRESNSKEVDAALLSVIGFPAFAVQDPALIERTRNEIITKLGGNYGCKRFLRDGHQAVLEDTTRLHYEPAELLIFEGIECEWPLFFTYLILDGIFFGDKKRTARYLAAIKPCLITAGDVARHYPNQASTVQGLDDSVPLVPEIFLVPKEAVEEEKAHPHTQQRLPNENIPLVWAESLYVLGQLLHEELLAPSDIDPLGRRTLPVYRRHRNVDTVVQICLLSENSVLQDKLAMYGLETQTLEQVAPITISSAGGLRDAFAYLGVNKKLGLTGRPRRPVGTLSTCKIYRIQDQLYAFTPHFMSVEEFYLTSDNDYLMSLFVNELSFVRTNWSGVGRPTMMVLLTNRMLAGMGPTYLAHGPSSRSRTSSAQSHGGSGSILNFFMNMRGGSCGDVRVRLGRLSELINTSCVESLDFLGEKFGEWSQSLCTDKSAQQARLQLSESKTKEAQSTHSRRGTLKTSSAHSLSSPTSRKGIDFFMPPTTSPTDMHHIKAGADVASGGGGESKAPEDKPRLKEHNYSRQRSNSIVNIEPVDDPVGNSGASMPKLDTKSLGSQDQHETPSGRHSPHQLQHQLSLVLGDPSAVSKALDALPTSENLFDQVDLLHYLHSCHGPQYYVQSLHATVNQLLEEVYQKALQLHMWSIVRQTAGLLRKVVNSLAINVTDLLIRQKHITIGTNLYDRSGNVISKEVTISSPLTPDALISLIYKHGSSDVREAPLIQEVVTTLGKIIRGAPYLLKGMIRFRMYYMVVALREEISRIRDCDEEEAIEHLMEMSPSEVEMLSDSIFRNHPTPFVHFEKTAPGSLSPSLASQPISLRGLLGLKEEAITKLEVSAHGAGFHDGNAATIKINGTVVPLNSRGLNVAIVDTVEGEILESVCFDTHFSSSQSEEFAELLDWVEPGAAVIIASKDEFCENLTESAIVACEKLGSRHIRSCKYRDSWAIISVKGDTSKDAVLESYSPANSGPTDVLARKIDLDALRSTNTGLHAKTPSQGRVYRKRKNDGALNRVPSEFYPRVWYVLDRSEGITIYDKNLPRHPTVHEKTPGEFNFATQVEDTLDAITESSERQLMVECLMIIHRLLQLNGGVKLHNFINVLGLIRTATMQFWEKWSPTALGKDKRDKSYEKNKQLARRAFADLPAEGADSTTFYLQQSIVAAYPDLTFTLAIDDFTSCDLA
ncbi:hypothetical protein RI367_000196 [Sorochytrium milnesiophthora]